MSKDSTQKEKKPARQLNRWSLGMLVIIQLALVFAIFISANYLSLHHHYRYDASRDKDYTLSSSTTNYLASAALQQRDQPVRWILAYRRTAPFYERVRAIAEEYVRLSNGKIELTIVDPIRSPDKMQEIIAAYGIVLVRDMIIIDARVDQSPVTTENKERIKELNPNIKIIPAEQMIAFNVVNEERKVTGFQGEDMMTARLVESIEGKPRRMALIADKSRIGARNTSTRRQVLEDVLRFQNVQLEEIEIANCQRIPDEIECLLLVAPQYDLTEEQLKVLEEYWQRPRSALLVLLGPDGAPAQIKTFLRNHGVTPNNDRIISRDSDGLITSASARFSDGVPFIAELARQTTEFGGASCSLDVREGADDLLNRRIYPVSLLDVSAGFWGETAFGTGEEAYDERDDNGPPLQLAASVTRGAQSDDRFAASTSRMIVIGNYDFLSPTYHRAENLDFLASSVNWLVRRDSLAGSSPRSLRTYKLPLLQAQMAFINRANLIFLPAALLLLGGFIWSSRRV